MAKQVYTGVLCALFAALVTIALSQGVSVSRDEVERMIKESEARTMITVTEMKSDQRDILKTVQKIEVALAGLDKK